MVSELGLAGSQDWFSTGISGTNPAITRFKNTFTSRPIRRYNPTTRRQEDTGMVEWEVTVRTFEGGLNGVWGDFAGISDKLGASSCITYFPGWVMLPPIVNTSTPANPGTTIGLHHYNIFDTMAIGVGADADECLFTATSGAPSARTYTPNGGSITCLAGIVIGGNTNAERLIVGNSSGVGEIFSDLAATPTSSGDMHANTNPLWGVIPTGLPDPSGTAAFVNLLYANGNIYRILTTAAIGDAPTSTNTPAPNGGWAIGVSAASGPKRAYWVWPSETTAGGILPGAAPSGHIWSTNLEGSDPQKLEIPLKAGVMQACLFQDGILYADLDEIYWYRNGKSINLGWNRERPATLTTALGRQFLVHNLGVYKGKLRVLLSSRTVGGSEGYNFQYEEFDEATGTWSAGSELLNDTIGSVYPVSASGYLPYSHDGETMYFAYLNVTPTFTFYRQRLQVPSQNLFFDPSDPTHKASGSIETGLWSLPGLVGVPSVAEEVIFGGFLYANFSGTAFSDDSSVAIAIGTQGRDAPSTTGALSETFRARDRVETRRRRWPDNTDAFTYLQITETLTRDTNAVVTSPNGVPFRVRGIAFPDGNVRSPREVRGY